MAEAKKYLSEVVARAITDGPQRIRRRRDSVVVIAEEEYRALKGEELTFEQYLIRVPKVEGLRCMLRRDPMRDPKL